MTNQNASQAVSLLGEGVVAYGKFMTNAIVNLSEALDKMIQKSEAEGEWRLLRDFEQGLQRLADAFSPCKVESRQARSESRGLNDDEYRAVALAWEDSRRAHLGVQALASLICSEARWRQWGVLTKELEEASNRLDEAIAGEIRRDIPALVWGFSKVLGKLQTEVSVELDRLLEGRWRASGEEVTR